jgi:RNA polymerase sigma-70 factor (sigma-E family)
VTGGGTGAAARAADPDGEAGQLLSVSDVFNEAYPGLVRLAYLLTGSKEVAEDVVQEAFARAQPRWDRIARPAAYVRASVVNGARMYHRQRARERAHFADLVLDDVSPETPMILDALEALPYKQRAALVLRYFEDRSEAEIAETLGCRPSTVRSLVHRGLHRLREVIEP